MNDPLGLTRGAPYNRMLQVPMTVLNTRVLDRFARKHRDARQSLTDWLATAEHADWTNIFDVRKTYPSADGVPIRVSSSQTVVVTVFNIKGNEYRLITTIDYLKRTIYVAEALTHAKYSMNAWKKRL